MVSRGFTLLEAVLALAILAGAMVACLQVRAQMLLGAERLREVQRADRAEEALFQMLVNQTLESPRVDEEHGILVWEGEYLGRAYRIERLVMSVANPMRGTVSYEVAREVRVYRYVMTYAGRESEIVWHR